MRVLIVDDEPDYRYLVVVGLTLEGHEVAEAHEASGAVALAGELRPDAILVDVVMIGGGGIGMIPRLRRVSPGSAIVLHTVERERVAPMIGHPAGPDGLLEKGMAPRDLSDALAGVVAVHQSKDRVEREP